MLLYMQKIDVVLPVVLPKRVLRVILVYGMYTDAEYTTVSTRTRREAREAVVRDYCAERLGDLAVYPDLAVSPDTPPPLARCVRALFALLQEHEDLPYSALQQVLIRAGDSATAYQSPFGGVWP